MATRPGDVADIVFCTFIYLDVDINVASHRVAHAIFQNLSITETILIIYYVDEFRIFLPALRGKLLRLEESSELTSLVTSWQKHLSRRVHPLILRVRKLFVSIDCLSDVPLIFLSCQQ